MPGDLKDELRKALRTCDRAVRLQAECQDAAPMASTLTMAYAAWTRLYIAHAGDSRCYLLREGDLVQLTRDQTLAQEFVDKGELTEAEAKDSRWSNVLTSVIGGEEGELQVQVKRLELADNDLVLLGTDGLHDAISDDKIRDILMSESSVEESTQRLLGAARSADDRNDATAVVARFRL